ncbi:RNA polymerase II degradation factor 1 [Pleurotus pulmonarius]
MSYKPTIRSQQQPPDQPQLENSKYRAQAKQLQELFPSWSTEDLLSLLAEVAGDVELAATRISEGHAEQWGSVTRKKEKKASIPGQTKDNGFSSPRGGRGGRGGGRGGLSGRGSPATRGRGGPPRGARTGTPRISSPAPEAHAEGDIKDKGAPDAHGPEAVNGRATGAEAPSLNGASSSKQEAPDPSAHVNGSAAASHVLPKPTKTPATSKMSWAQIARSQEKAAPPPAPIVAPTPISAPAPAPESEPEPVPPAAWEEPTTVQPPTWDDEPPAKPPAAEAVSEEIEEPQSEPAPAEATPEPEAEVPQELPPARSLLRSFNSN